MAFLGSIGGI